MNTPLLKVSNLQVSIEDKLVVNRIDFEINPGEVVAIVGANGSGKSSLAHTLLGDARYQVLDSSKVEFEGRDLLAMSVDERARAGIYVAWQNPVTIPGVSVFSLCKASFEARGKKIRELVAFKKQLENLAVRVGLSGEYVGRNVNEGFSGGEKKRLELLQLLLLEPKLVVLDEIDSGLDSHGVEILIDIIVEMKKKSIGFILITHNKKLLKDVGIDKTWEMKNGKLSTGI